MENEKTIVLVDMPSIMDIEPDALISLADNLRKHYGECPIRVYHVDMRRRTLDRLNETLDKAGMQ